MYSNSGNCNLISSISNAFKGVFMRFHISKTLKSYKNCIITEKSKNPSNTAKNLASYFNCKNTQADTDISDIIMNLGALEEPWLIN